VTFLVAALPIFHLPFLTLKVSMYVFLISPNHREDDCSFNGYSYMARYITNSNGTNGAYNAPNIEHYWTGNVHNNIYIVVA